MTAAPGGVAALGACAASLADAVDRVATEIARLLDAARAVQQALVAGDAPDLQRAVAAQEAALAALQRAEGDRERASAALADALGLPPSAPGKRLAAALAAAGDVATAQRIASAIDRAAGLWADLARVCDQNRALARQGLAAVQAVLRLVGGQDPPDVLADVQPERPLCIDRHA